MTQSEFNNVVRESFPRKNLQYRLTFLILFLSRTRARESEWGVSCVLRRYKIEIAKKLSHARPLRNASNSIRNSIHGGEVILHEISRICVTPHT